MADIKKFLKTKGYTDEQLAGVDQKMLTDLAELATEMEEGITARQRAEQIKQDLEVVKGEWNKYVVQSDSRAAAAEGRVAQLQAHLKALKAQGYEIPDAYMGEAATEPVKKPESAAPPTRDGSQDLLSYAKANMALISMSNKYRALTGSELDPEIEYEDFEKNKRPNENLRTYIDRKYDLSAKEAAKAAEKTKAYEDNIRAEAKKEALAEYQKTNGANPETRNPKASKFDVIREDKDRSAGWNRPRNGTQADAIDRRRIEKYASSLPN